MELFSRSGSKYGCELAEAYLFEKNSDEYSVAFRSFAKKEDILKDMKKWLAFVNSEVLL